MLTGERHYTITKSWVKKLEASIAAHDGREPAPDVHLKIHQTAGDALRIEAEELRRQLQGYERLRADR